MVGLYSSYSRKLHYARRTVVRWTGLTSRWLDPQFGRKTGAGQRDAWYQDQYCHPHETCHSLDQVMGWMGEAGLEFVNSIPKPTPRPSLAPDELLFAPKGAGSRALRVLSQLQNMSSGYREGGFLVAIGQRTSDSETERRPERRTGFTAHDRPASHRPRSENHAADAAAVRGPLARGLRGAGGLGILGPRAPNVGDGFRHAGGVVWPAGYCLARFYPPAVRAS